MNCSTSENRTQLIASRSLATALLLGAVACADVELAPPSPPTALAKITATGPIERNGENGNGIGLRFQDLAKDQWTLNVYVDGDDASATRVYARVARADASLSYALTVDAQLTVRRLTTVEGEWAETAATGDPAHTPLSEWDAVIQLVLDGLEVQGIEIEGGVARSYGMCEWGCAFGCSSGAIAGAIGASAFCAGFGFSGIGLTACVFAVRLVSGGVSAGCTMSCQAALCSDSCQPANVCNGYVWGYQYDGCGGQQWCSCGYGMVQNSNYTCSPSSGGGGSGGGGGGSGGGIEGDGSCTEGWVEDVSCGGF